MNKHADCEADGCLLKAHKGYDTCERQGMCNELGLEPMSPVSESAPTAPAAGESPTPRTDANKYWSYAGQQEVVSAEFACELERELILFDAIRKESIERREKLEAAEAEVAALKRDIERHVEIAGKEAAALDAAVLAEREACADIAFDYNNRPGEEIAKLIRARATDGGGK